MKRCSRTTTLPHWNDRVNGDTWYGHTFLTIDRGRKRLRRWFPLFVFFFFHLFTFCCHRDLLLLHHHHHLLFLLPRRQRRRSGNGSRRTGNVHLFCGRRKRKEVRLCGRTTLRHVVARGFTERVREHCRWTRIRRIQWRVSSIRIVVTLVVKVLLIRVSIIRIDRRCCVVLRCRNCKGR